MGRRNRSSLRLIMLEMDKAFPTPALEILLILPFLFASFYILQYIPGISTFSDFVPDLYNYNEIIDTMTTLGTKKFAEILYPINTISLFIVPMLISYNVARELEIGLSRTMLSFPIERKSYLLNKIILVIGIIVVVTIVELALTVSLFIPYGFYIEHMMLMFLSFSVLVFTVAATTTLIAINTKNMLSSAILGCGLWYGLLYLAMFSDYDPVLRGIFNPVLMSISFAGEGAVYPLFSNIIIQDVITSIGCTMVIGLLGLLGALKQFDRMGI